MNIYEPSSPILSNIIFELVSPHHTYSYQITVTFLLWSDIQTFESSIDPDYQIELPNMIFSHDNVLIRSTPTQNFKQAISIFLTASTMGPVREGFWCFMVQKGVYMALDNIGHMELC